MVCTVDTDGTTVLDNAVAQFPLYNFMPGWKLGDQQIYIYDCLPPPPTRGYFPDQDIPMGTSISVSCPCNEGNKPCEVILSQYHCPACSGAKNGGWPGVLPGLGWRPGSCSAFMSSTPGPIEQAEEWKTLGWRKLVAAGTTEEIPIVGAPLEHVGVFVRQCAVDCTQVDPSWKFVPDECSCDMTGCWSNWCPPREPPPVAPVPCEMTPGCAPSLL